MAQHKHQVSCQALAFHPLLYLALLRPVWATTVTALLCVCVSQGLSAYLPKVQGDIITALVQGTATELWGTASAGSHAA